MKRTTLKSSLMAGLTSLFLLFHGFGCVKETTLADVTKPYLGEYECTQAQYGNTDYLKLFTYIKIEFESDNKYTVFYQMKDGNPKQASGKYTYDKDAETVTMQADEIMGIKKKFPIKNGELVVNLEIGKKELVMKFAQK